MAQGKSRSIPVAELMARARLAAAEGKFSVAQGLARDAVVQAPRDMAVRQCLVQSAIAGDDWPAALGAAADWLAIAPQSVEAVETLGWLADTFDFEDIPRVDPRALRIALATPRVSKVGIARVALRHQIAADAVLAAILHREPDEIEQAGREMALTGRLTAALTSELTHQALAAAMLTDHRLERLLTGFRAGLLLDTEPSALADPARFTLALALLSQLWLNDHAFAETVAERGAIMALQSSASMDPTAGVEATQRQLLLLLYLPLDAVDLGRPTSANASRLRPKAYGQMLADRLAADEVEASLASGIARLADPTDATSRAVKAQYEAAPYPRWISMTPPGVGSLTRFLATMPGCASDAVRGDAAFDVLIAGAGTGQQVARSAIGYGPRARITALDLSSRSLGYAARKAAEFGIDGVRWTIGDILDVGRSPGRYPDRYDVIECVGVLHHMADPFAGWRCLLDVLAPDGIMLVGLYSRTARTDITAARADPAGPASGCDDAAARAWRRVLLDRPADSPTASLVRSRNFNALSEFRDLVLHTSERQFDIAEIETFLAANGLRFLGFMLQPAVLSAFATRYPEPGLPGRLADWAAFEADHPTTFEAMYCFWVVRA